MQNNLQGNSPKHNWGLVVSLPPSPLQILKYYFVPKTQVISNKLVFIKMLKHPTKLGSAYHS